MVLLRFYSYPTGNRRKWEENMFSYFSTRVGQVLTRVRLVRPDTGQTNFDTGLVRQIWKLGKKSE